MLFKSLYDITAMKFKKRKRERIKGISYDVWKDGIFRLQILPEELVKKIFLKVNKGTKGVLNWRDFLECMRMISAKTMTDKIDLFIKIADDDGNGELSYEEIHRLCMLCLQKYI